MEIGGFVDYWILNKVTIKDNHYIPIIDELLIIEQPNLKIDLRDTYHQNKKIDEDVKKNFEHMMVIVNS